MRIRITGAGGNLGRGLVQQLGGRHELVLYDLVPIDTKHEFYQADIQTGWRITEAARGCDVLVHLAAWHGIHSYVKTETDYWRLNVDGTFHALPAAIHARIPRVV
jgi:nucleoside-diphosphate-sugar epimerase